MSRGLLATVTLWLVAFSLFAQGTNLAAQFQQLAKDNMASYIKTDTNPLFSQGENFTALLQYYNEEIKKNPDEPESYRYKAICLMALAQYDEGYQCAQDAMTRYIKSKDKLSLIMLECIHLKDYTVTIHFNMGPYERQHPKQGVILIRPVSFRVFSKDKDKNITSLNIFDFEIMLRDGKPSTATIGQTRECNGEEENSDYEVFDPGLKYSEVRKIALEVIKKVVK